MPALFSYKTEMCCAGIDMYMYKDMMKYLFAIFLYADVTFPLGSAMGIADATLFRSTAD